MYSPIAAFFAILTLSLAQDDVCDNIDIPLIGAGSSFPAVLYNQLGPKYAATRGRHNRNVRYAFVRVNSGYARERITMTHPEHKDPVAFGASEGELSDQQRLSNPDIKTFPVLAGAVVIVYNLPEAEAVGAKLKLHVDVLPKIYSGTIQYWDHPDITSTNQNISFPHQKIRVVARSDNSGDTGIFTDALGRFDQNWYRVYGPGFSNPSFDENGKTQKWPQKGAVIEFWAKQATGMDGIVASIPYTIGYVALPNAEEVRQIGSTLVYAHLINKIGRVTEPNISSVQAAMDYFHGQRPGQLVFKLNNALYEAAYPMASFSYFMVNASTHPAMSCCSMQELTGFIDYLISSERAETFKENHLAPLSDAVRQTVNTLALKTIFCETHNMWGAYLESQIVRFTIEVWMIVLAVMGALSFVLFVIGGLYAWHMRKEQMAKENKWIIASSRISLDDPDPGSLRQDLVSPTTLNRPSIITTSARGSTSVMIDMTVKPPEQQHPYTLAAMDQMPVMLEPLGKNYPYTWNRETKVMINKLREEVDHPNVLHLLGISLLDSSSYAVFEDARKGTLHSVLQTSKYDLDNSIKYNMGIDVAMGMSYLHRRHILHGLLSSLTCFVNSRWTVKVGGWERYGLLNRENTQQMNSELFTYSSKMDKVTIIKLMYMDPELMSNSTRFGADVYSFGILLSEIFTRQVPFFDEVEEGLVSYSDLVAHKFFDHTRGPRISAQLVPQAARELVNLCTGVSHSRPQMDDVCRMLDKVKPTEKGVVDVMMETMEKYMDSLERKVDERTGELKLVTERVQDLLHQVLPPSIATQLFKGEVVEPEIFDNVSVYFSDIVGFTTISSRSKPIEVMRFLNDLWLVFDSIIELFDVYKVDTIGDAYFVCSGLPDRNGIAHAKHVADLALTLLAKCSLFKIQHMPSEQLRIRVGLHSGPVTAGIVGTKMPQYCVFGETVNTAMTMESKGEALKIHVSEPTYKLLTENYPQYNLEHRCELEISGRGKMNTYWLVPPANHPVYDIMTKIDSVFTPASKGMYTDSKY